MNILRFMALASLATLAACQQGGKDAAKPADKPDPAADVVATVDGATLTRGTFDFYVKAATGKSSGDLSPEQRQEALDSLVRMQLVAPRPRRTASTRTRRSRLRSISPGSTCCSGACRPST